ncbi:hypothetical protein YC2023_048905 [Brassica napus]
MDRVTFMQCIERSPRLILVGLNFYLDSSMAHYQDHQKLTMFSSPSTHTCAI